ncbi:MAG TPA: Asp-tRNA(Asn)/Glu-tRNA(Gln) amidotransferase subunit GatC [Exilispira sp.]|nr:Asp-tRNA(Asn)/Glu-tRNA(Gln) amidotransferase subunit GatC [Exilispira sp.]
MDEYQIQKLSFLSRFSKIDGNLEKDFESILGFVNKISEFNIETYQLEKFKDERKILSNNLREDEIKNLQDNKDIVKNFSNKEDQFCIVPLIIEKEKS